MLQHRTEQRQRESVCVKEREAKLNRCSFGCAKSWLENGCGPMKSSPGTDTDTGQSTRLITKFNFPQLLVLNFVPLGAMSRRLDEAKVF